MCSKRSLNEMPRVLLVCNKNTWAEMFKTWLNFFVSNRFRSPNLQSFKYGEGQEEKFCSRISYETQPTILQARVPTRVLISWPPFRVNYETLLPYGPAPFRRFFRCSYMIPQCSRRCLMAQNKMQFIIKSCHGDVKSQKIKTKKCQIGS